MTVRHFLDLDDLEPAQLRAILDDAHRRKRGRQGRPKGAVDADAPARERTLAMVFEKNSTRTRFSFDAAMRQLGGAAIIATAADMQLGRGESIEDTARVLSRMVDAVMIRANRHEDVAAFAAASDVPVINGLTDRSHPCQILADLLTLEEAGLDLRASTIAWVGDGNNVLNSLMQGAAAFGYRVRVAAPAGYAPRADDVARAADRQGRIELVDSPQAAVEGADAVVTDTWVSMGDTDYEQRMAAFAGFGVDDALMARANAGAKFLHCLPAHRGEEVTDAVLDGPASLAWDEAENRIHAQKSVLAWCFGAI